MADVSLLFSILATDNTAGGLNSASSRMDKFKRGVGLAAVGILGAATVMGKKAVEIASDTAESTSKVQTLLGKSSASAMGFAETSAKAFGMSKREALGSVGSMAAVQVAMGASQKEAAKLSVEYTKLSADLGSFNNASSAEVQEALTASLSGEYEMLKKYGIVVNDSTLAIEAQRIGMEKNGATWTAAQKKTLSYNIIMASTKAAQGDFARTSSGLANSTKILSAEFEDLQGKIGAKLLPVVNQIMGAFVDLATRVENNQSKAKMLAIVIGSVAGAVVAASIAVKAYALAQGVATVASAAFGAINALIWSPILGPIALVTVALVAVGAVFVLLWKRSETFRTVVTTAFNAMKTVVMTAIQVLANTVLGFWGMMIHGAASAFGWVPKIGGKLKAADAEFAKFRDSVNAKLSGIKNPKAIHIAVTDDTAAAATRVRNLRAQVQGGGWSIAIKTSGPPAGIGVRLPARARGGPVSAGQAYLVGENGPEIVTPSKDGYVHANGSGTVGAGGGGRQVIEHRVVLQLEGQGDLVDLLRKAIRVRGGDPVRVLRAG